MVEDEIDASRKEYFRSVTYSSKNLASHRSTHPITITPIFWRYSKTTRLVFQVQFPTYRLLYRTFQTKHCSIWCAIQNVEKKRTKSEGAKIHVVGVSDFSFVFTFLSVWFNSKKLIDFLLIFQPNHLRARVIFAPRKRKHAKHEWVAYVSHRCVPIITPIPMKMNWNTTMDVHRQRDKAAYYR